MELENKYYTPTIEELSINQEVYLLDTGNYKAEYTKEDIYPMLVIITELTDYPTIWVKTKGDGKGFKTYEIYPDQIGLKYLDKSDIESLGWKYAQYLDRNTICLNFERPNDWYLNYWFGEIPYVEISKDGYDTGCALNIKNKSELKVLMKQLGINE